MTTKQQIAQLNATIKQAMRVIPAGEQLHIAMIIGEQNCEILRLKKVVREMKKARRG